MEKTSPGLCPSKGTAVWTFIATYDYDVANQQFVNIITAKDLKLWMTLLYRWEYYRAERSVAATVGAQLVLYS